MKSVGNAAISESEDMKYILSDQFVLRGFNHGKNKVIKDFQTGISRKISEAELFFLTLCDGKTDDMLLARFPGMGKMTARALENGWIRQAQAGEQLSPFQIYREIATPEIVSVQLSITGLCNASCRHCFVTDHQHTRKDLTTEEMLEVLRRLADASVSNVSLTGGEPLMRKDLPVLLDEMQKLNIHVESFLSNGFLLNDRILELFLQHEMRPAIQISFDGPGHHDWMRRVDGAEKMAVAAMESCRRYDFPFALSMCIHKGNMHLLADTVKLGAEKGACEIRFAPVFDFGDFTQDKGISLLSADELFRTYMDFLPVLLKEKPNIDIEMREFMRINAGKAGGCVIGTNDHFCSDPGKDRLCTCVDNFLCITADGRVLPCFTASGTFLEEDCLKLTEHSLEECINSPIYQRFRQITAGDVLKCNLECRECEYLPYCGCGCRGTSIAVHNDLYGKDDIRCAFFRHGWSEKLKAFLKTV